MRARHAISGAAIYDEHKRVGGGVYDAPAVSGGNDYSRAHGPRWPTYPNERAGMPSWELRTCCFSGWQGHGFAKLADFRWRIGAMGESEALVRMVRLTRPEVSVSLREFF